MIEIQGLEKIIAKLEKATDLKDDFTKAALFVEGVAREKAPKRTGMLKGNIETKVEQHGSTLEATIFSPEHYSVYQEFGTGLFAVNGNGRKTGWAYEDEQTGEIIFTRGNRPHPFLGPALRENTDTVMQYLREGLKND